MNQQPLNNMKIDGFFPVIMNVAPINLPLLLSDLDKKDDSNNLIKKPALGPAKEPEHVGLLDS